MSMVVQHNLTAMNSNRMLGITTSAQAKSTEKLSSGYRINRAADDAAGLTISEKMRKQMRGLDRASTNAQDGVSAVQTAEGALTEVHSMLQRMNELATQASNGTNSEADRQAIQNEIDQLNTEIDRVAETTKFNELYLLKGDEGKQTTAVAAHDAGLKGKLIDNGDGTSVFQADALKDGDKVNIAGVEYTIGGKGVAGASADKIDPRTLNKDITGYTAASALSAVTGLSAGDSMTIGGKTYTLTDNISVDELKFNGGAGSFKIGDTVYTVNGGATPNAATMTAVKDTKAAQAAIKEALAEGKQVTVLAATVGAYDAATTSTAVNKALTAGNVVLALEDGEISRGNLSTGIGADAKANDILAMVTGQSVSAAQAGDSVTKDGDTTTATKYEPKAAKDIYDAINGLATGSTVTVGDGKDAKTYTIVDSAEEEDAEAYKLTKESILAKIHDGDTVNYTGAANALTVIGDIGPEEKKGGAENTISAEEAYAKMAEELQKASSIGTDDGKEASVANNGDGKFTITQGTVEYANTLNFNLHVGADADMTNKINVKIDTMNTAYLGIQKLDVIGEGNDGGISATYAIDSIADAISKVSAQRSALGAVQNRLEHTIANLDNVVENTTAAESRIRDTDMADEMVEYSKNNILAQAGQSMLAQANQSNQGVLSLLG